MVPFNKYLGLRVLSVDDGTARVELPWSEELLNHVGTQHAAGLFATGEAASGGAVFGALADILESTTLLAQGAEIQYTAPANGSIVATATLTTGREQVLSQLESGGWARFPVEVELEDEQGQQVATMTVRWHLGGTGANE